MSEVFYPSQPDYFVYPRAIVPQEADPGEIAARLGSLSTYRRTGRLIWFNNFIDLTGWRLDQPTMYSSSRAELYSGAASLKTSPGTEGYTRTMWRDFPAIPETVGLEMTIFPTWSTLGGPTKFPRVTSIILEASNPSYDDLYGIDIHWNLLQIKIQLSGGPQALLSIPSLSPPRYIWHNFKVSLNLRERRYGWIYFDNLSVYAGDYPPPASSSSGNFQSVQLAFGNEAGYDNNTFVSSMILSTNELV